MNLDLIRTEHDIEAMVAADSFPLLVERVTRMVRAGRPMAVALREFTYEHRPPVLYAGLRLDSKIGDGGIMVYTSDHNVHCGFLLTNGGDRHEDRIRCGFGADVYQDSGNETEQQARRRYREHKDESPDPFERRRDMTHVALTGGIPGMRYQATDSITITAWNRDGVATELVIGFAADPSGSWY